MNVEDIKKIPIKNITNTDSILFLWCTYPMLREAQEVIESWGFKYKTIAFQWIKKNKRSNSFFFGLGRWTRGNTECCLLAVKGKPKRISNKVSQLIISPIREHSRKPDETREKIIEEFHKQNSSFNVIIANPFAVSESISLHKACHNAIYMERSFNAAHFIQSKDRIHRYGLKPGTETNYYYLLSENSVDEVIHTRLIAKETRLQNIIESMPIPLFANVGLETGDDDIKALITEYVNRTKKM